MHALRSPAPSAESCILSFPSRPHWCCGAGHSGTFPWGFLLFVTATPAPAPAPPLHVGVFPLDSLSPPTLRPHVADPTSSYSFSLPSTAKFPDITSSLLPVPHHRCPVKVTGPLGDEQRILSTFSLRPLSLLSVPLEPCSLSAPWPSSCLPGQALSSLLCPLFSMAPVTRCPPGWGPPSAPSPCHSRSSAWGKLQPQPLTQTPAPCTHHLVTKCPKPRSRQFQQNEEFSTEYLNGP